MARLRPRALILAPFAPETLSSLSHRVDVQHESWMETRQLWDPEALGTRLRDDRFSLLVVEADFVFEEVFERAQGLRFVGVCRGGVNNVDIEAATAHGVVVVNTPGRNAAAVAEMTLTLMLALARRLPPSNDLVKRGGWTDPVTPYFTLRGSELGGKTAGLIGCGAVGARTARLLRAVGMKVLVYDPYAGEGAVRLAGGRVATLEELLRRSDFVSLHCADTEETNGMIDAERIAMMKPGAFIVNTACAAAIDEHALAQALRDGRVAGAALDVFPSHPVAPNYPLLMLDNVIVTPHLGGATGETIRRQSEMIARDLRRFLRGRRPLHLLNPGVWPPHV